MAYTTREKVRFVERMWAEGLTPTAASRKWGRPCREALRKWELQALDGKLPAQHPVVYGSCEHKRHQRWPKDTKAEAIRRVKAGEKSEHVARSLGISGGYTITAWIREEKKRTLSCSDPSVSPNKTTGAHVNKDLLKRIAELEKKNKELEEEKAALMELMRDPKAGDPARLSSRQKVEFGERLRRERGWRLTQVLTFLAISKSTYLYNRARIDEVALPEEDLDKVVLESFSKSHGTYGYRRISFDTGMAQRKVRLSMKRQDLHAKHAKHHKKWSSYQGEISDAPPNLLLGKRGHNFSADAPNQKWVTDITEMKAGGKRVYLSVILDLFDCKPVAWRCSGHPDEDLANLTLKDAVATLKPEEHPILHSDRGAHYRWPTWIRICNEAGITRSMSRKAHSPDNAACEAFFGRMKVEMYYARDWSEATVEDLKEALGQYMIWYTSERLTSFKVPGRRTRTCYETIGARRKHLGFAA